MPDWARAARVRWARLIRPDRATLERWGRDGLANAWPLLQIAFAVTIAWLIATRLGGRTLPFFAPTAALIAFGVAQGERGWRVVRLVYGVFLGILIGEFTALVLGSRFYSLGIATFIAVLLPTLLRADRLVVVQSAAAAILTVVAAGGEAGLGRLFDAVVGTAVALLFTQVFFPPEPVALVRRAERTALDGLADGLDLAAEAIERNDDSLVEEAMAKLRGMREDLLEVGRMREASTRVATRSAIWWFRRGVTRRENENAGQLDLLGASCLMLMRTILGADAQERRRLVPNLRELSRVLHDLAAGLGDRRVRQQALEQVHEVLMRPMIDKEGAHVSMVAAMASVRMVSYDLLVFAGLEEEDALDLVQEGIGAQRVAAPPATFRVRLPRAPLSLPRRLWSGSRWQRRRRERRRDATRPPR